MKTIFTLFTITIPLMAHPPQAPQSAPPLPIPPRVAYPQGAQRVTLPERPGRQLLVDDPIVEDVFVQPRVRQRVTYLPTQYEQVEEIPAAVPMSYAMPTYAAPARYATYAAPAYYAAPRYYAAPVYAEPAGAYTRAEYGPLFGRLRKFETTGDPARIPRSAPGPVRTLLFGD